MSYNLHFRAVNGKRRCCEAHSGARIESMAGTVLMWLVASEPQVQENWLSVVPLSTTSCY